MFHTLSFARLPAFAAIFTRIDLMSWKTPPQKHFAVHHLLRVYLLSAYSQHPKKRLTVKHFTTPVPIEYA